MNIQPISNTNFKGLFTDKTSQNNGHWKMEYSPYSWESGNTSKMAPKETFNEYSRKLPDNEEIYTETAARKESKDIFGTVTYYVNKNTGEMRRTITEVPAMNYEESLKVRDKKLEVLLQQKNRDLANIDGHLKEQAKRFETAYKDYNYYSEDYDQLFFDRQRNRDDNKAGMDRAKVAMDEAHHRYKSSVESYNIATNRIQSIHDLKAQDEKDLALIAMAKETGNYIDISRRDVAEPDKPLIEALRDMKSAMKKTVALPDRLISVKELVKIMGDKIEAAKLPELCSKTVAKLIKVKA